MEGFKRRDMAEMFPSEPIKKVLFIAYYFPPAGGAGVIRSVKYCKFLPRFSWIPVVLTVKNPLILEKDPTLAEDISKSIIVYRTATLQFPEKIYGKKPQTSGKQFKTGFFKKIKKNYFKLFKQLSYACFCIDEHMGWIPFALFRGWRIIKADPQIKCIYVSVKPFSTVITALALKKLTGKPLVIDFRDAWTAFTPYFWNGKPGYFKKFEAYLEKKAVINSDLIVSVSEKIIEDFQTTYSMLPRSRFICIPNGFDQEDFNSLPPPATSDKFIITYAGSFYAKRSPESLFSALKKIFAQEPQLRGKIRFRYIGYSTSSSEYFFDDADLKDIIEITGMLPYRECLLKIKESNLLLLIEDRVAVSDRIMTSKIFEYLASEKPILALAREGPIKELIRKTHSGMVLDHEDIDGIMNAIRYFMQKNCREDIPVGFNDIMSVYSRETAGKRLSEAFNALNAQ